MTKLVYDCGNQFPPSLLNVLHKYHSQCKLYHLKFQLRSLRSETLDPHEMAIATSPCLHSIKVRYAFQDSNGEDDFHMEAIQELASGLAPNLKEVHIVNIFPETTQNWVHRHRIPREPWRGLPGSVSGREIGLLTSLSLTRSVDFKLYLQTWNERIDFSSLNHLALGGGFYEHHYGINGEVMEWIAQNCSLPRLKTLRISLDRDEREDLKPNYTNNALTFFKALEPLHELIMDGPLEPEIFNVILSQHGRTLRKLGLCPAESLNFEYREHIPMIFEKEHLLQIQAQCPALQDLAISVKRTKSDAREVEIYKSFGKMEHLQVLFLTLDCFNAQVTRGSTSTNDPSFDEDDRKFYDEYDGLRMLKRGHVRETLINCAVDETLARSICETICRDKAGKRLESLKLYTTGGHIFGGTTRYSDINDVVDNLSRSWLIERSVRDDEDIINVRELGREARETRDKEESDFDDEHYEGDRTGSALPDYSPVHIFRRIWAGKEGSKDWREDWTSFPLYN